VLSANQLINAVRRHNINLSVSSVLLNHYNAMTAPVRDDHHADYDDRAAQAGRLSFAASGTVSG